MDNTFGPVLPDHFDFTLLFERSMLGMVPAGIAILIVPVYLRAMARAANQVRPGRLLWAKLATAAALVGIQLASIILWHNAGLLRSDVALAASITSLVASLGIAIILYIAHTFFLCPSAFLSVYFSLTMVFDVTMARSYFLRHSIDALGGLQVTVAGLKLVLVLLEEVPKRQLFRSNLLRPGLGETVGFWNRTLLLWVNPLLRLGFRKNIHVEDLPEIGDRYDSQRLFDRFVPQWKNGKASCRHRLLLHRADEIKPTKLPNYPWLLRASVPCIGSSSSPFCRGSAISGFPSVVHSSCNE